MGQVRAHRQQPEDESNQVPAKIAAKSAPRCLVVFSASGVYRCSPLPVVDTRKRQAVLFILATAGIDNLGASVICVVALGAGSQERVLANINSLGTNTLEIFPGRDFGDTRSAKIKTLVLADASVLGQQPYVAAVTPTVSTTSTLRFGAIEASAQASG